MKVITSIFICLFFTGITFGQKPNTRGIQIIGQVVDKDAQAGLEFATISLLSKIDSSTIDGTLSGANGRFSIQMPKKPFLMVVEYIAYKKRYISEFPRPVKGIIDLKSIEIQVSSQQINEVTIRAEKSTNEFSLDKRVFNVGRDLANRGGNAEEILDNVPSVTVDIDGTVNLRGSTGVRILIDGKPSRLASSMNGLKNIPSEMIQSIEVITNPSSRYEAEGLAGIINIILKKEKRSGFNGSFDTNISYPLGAGLGANINYRKGNINWFAGLGLRYRTSPGYGIQRQERYRNNEVEITEQTRDMQRKSLGHNYRGGLEYFLNDKQSVSASIRYKKSNDNNLNTLIYKDYLKSSPNQITYVDRIDKEKEGESGLQYNVDYNHEFSSRDHKLNINLQYEDDLEQESSDFEQRTRDSDAPLFQRSSNDEGQRNYIFKVDYKQPLGSKDHQYELGWLSSWRNISNDFKVESQNENKEWISLSNFTNIFDYQENIHGVYAQYGNKFGPFGFQVGVRSEYAQINTELRNTSETNKIDTINFFPSLFLNYEINKGNAIQASYSSRVRRPRFWDLNPFFTYSDPRNFFSGNPRLRPEYTDSYELNYIRYWDNVTLSSGVYYRYTTDVIMRIKKLVEGEDRFETAPVNLGVEHDAGFELNGSYSFKRAIRINANMNIFRNKVISGQNNPALDVESIVGTGRLSSKFSYKQHDLQVSANYRSPRKRPQGYRKSITTIDLTWSKDFLPKKNLTISLGVRDLLNSRKRRYEFYGDGFNSVGEFQWRSRVINLAASYRINQKKQRRRGGGGAPMSEGF